MRPNRSFPILAAILAALLVALAAPRAEATRLKDLVEVEGFRGNALVGIGLVSGLNGTGDDLSSNATKQPLSALMKHLGTYVEAADIRARNVALVTVTATLPPFARPGMHIDVSVSSMGTAKSIAGGTLLATPLHGGDRNVYALAQGALTVGGFSAGGASGGSATKNTPTAGRIPGGGVIEREAPSALPDKEVVLLLHDPDYTTATNIAAAIVAKLGKDSAKVRDPATVVIPLAGEWAGRPVELIATLEPLEAEPDMPARVIVDERTGTVVVGAQVSLAPASVAHGDLQVQVTEQAQVAQPGALSAGKTAVVQRTAIDTEEKEGQLHALPKAATVADVAAALNALGVKPRDLLSILQALRLAGALRAEIQVM